MYRYPVYRYMADGYIYIYMEGVRCMDVFIKDFHFSFSRLVRQLFAEVD